MKYLKTYKLFEKTTLLNIGVPYNVMQTIQRNYALSDNSKWSTIKNKTDIRKELKKTKSLIISVCENKILIFYSFSNDLFIETFEYIINDDFGDSRWERISRIKTDIKDVIDNVDKKCKMYLLDKGEWSNDFSNVRKMNKEDKKFDEVTNNFKKDFAKKFTRIVKKLYGRRSNMVSDTIIDYLKDVNDDTSENKIREILFLNVDKAKEVEYYRNKNKQKDPFKLYSDAVRADSLTIFDDYLITFEDYYSNKEKEYLNLPIMIERWGRDKIMTAFMVYLYNGRLLEL